MSGLAGCFFYNTQSKGFLEENILSMLKALAVGDNVEKRYSCSADSIAFGYSNSNNVNTGMIYEDSKFIICFNGHLTNKNNLTNLLALHYEKEASIPQILLKLIRERRGEIFSLLEGIYSYAIWEKDRKQLYIATDRHGYEFVYYYRDSKKFIFASEIKSILSILGSKPEPDIYAICDIFNFHSVFNNKTPFKHIHLLPHAANCIVSQGNCNIRQFWDYPFSVEHHKDNEDFLLDKAKQLIQTSVDNSINEFDKIGIMLSGGLDSRLLAAVARNRVNDAIALSIRYSEAKLEENIIASQVATCLNMKFQYFNSPKNNIIDLIENSITDTDGQQGFCDILPTIKEIAREYPGIGLINGFLMDTLFKSNWVLFNDQGYDDISFIEELMKMHSRVGNYIYKKVFVPDFAKLVKDRKRETVQEGIIGHALNNPLEATLRFYCLNRGRRTHNTVFRAFKRYLNIIVPGTDYQLSDFAFRLPYHLRSSPDFYRKLIYTWFPEVGKIPWDRTGKPLTEGIKKNNKKYINILSKAKYLVQRVSKGKIDLINSPQSFNSRFRNSKEFRETIKDILLDRRSLNRGFYNRNGIETIIKEQMTGKDYGNAFKSLLTVEMLYRKFIDRDINE